MNTAMHLAKPTNTQSKLIQITMTSKFTNFNWVTWSDATSEPYCVRGLKAVEYIHWAALRTLAIETRNIPCEIGEQFGLGERHVVWEIVFDNGEHWIARVGIPPVNHNKEENYIPTPLPSSWTGKTPAWRRAKLIRCLFFMSIPIYDYHASSHTTWPQWILLEHHICWWNVFKGHVLWTCQTVGVRYHKSTRPSFMPVRLPFWYVASNRWIH